MTRIDLVAVQQRLAQQQPKPATPVRAEPPSWSTRPAPASALRTAPAAAPAGTLRATMPMRAALPLKATNARAERVEERARVNTLRAQIDELNAALAVANAEAERALTEERQRADRLNKQVEALSAEVMRAEKQAEVARDAERTLTEALRSTLHELVAEQARMAEMHSRELAVAQHDAHAAKQAVAELRRAEAERKGRDRLARVLAAWRGE
jgi:hypothetical protein